MVLLLLIFGIIIVLYFICALKLGEAITFRKALKKKMVRAVPELEKPKTKEDVVAMRQVFEEIGFFDYVAEDVRDREVCLFAAGSLLIFFMLFITGWMVEDLNHGQVLSSSFLMFLPMAALTGFGFFMDYRKERGIIRKCRDAESLSACSEEECVSHFKSFYEIYQDYRQRFLGDQDRQRWKVIRAAAAVGLLCLAVIIYMAVDDYIGLGPGPKKNRQYSCEYQILEDNSAEIISYFGKEPQVSIPDSLDGHPVLIIGAGAFEDNYELLSVELPDGIVEIGDSAFKSCWKLNKAELPDGVKKIGNSAFNGCYRLKEVELPDGLKSIGDSAFAYCDSLTEMHIPDSVEKLGNDMFTCCDSLRTVNIPRLIEEIPESMFYGCGQLRSCSIPETVRSIGKRAFSDSGITRLELPSGIKSIEGRSFSGCSSLEEIRVSEGNSCLKVLDGVLFSADGRTIVLYPRNRKQTEFEIPEGTEVIGPYAFESSSFLEKVILPQSLTDIGEYAFYNCEKLTELNSVGKLNYIGVSAFSLCPGLAEEMLPDAETNYDDYWRSKGYNF